MADEPIEEPGYIHGVTVVDIGHLRVARGMTRRPASSCRHTRLNYDPGERRIWCKDCERDVEAFDAFAQITEAYSGAYARLKKREEQLVEAEHFQARSRAAKELDKAWRSKTMLPCCPSCSEGLFPEDFISGVAMMGHDYAEMRRAKKKNSRP